MPLSLQPDGGYPARQPTGDRLATGERRLTGEQLPSREQRPHQWLAALALAGIASSLALMFIIGLLGPSITESPIPSAWPWPLYYIRAHPAAGPVAYLGWIAVLGAAGGVVCGLVALRRGWRPAPRLLIAGSLIGIVLLLLVPAIGSTDLKSDAVDGRIAALGHNPYVMTPQQLMRTGDPVAKLGPRMWMRDTSPYGPLTTVAQMAASELGGTSGGRTMFWLKVWNALAFLAVAMALDRFLRADAAGRLRAHLLWTVNPLMLMAVVEDGHNDVIGALFGVLAVLALRRLDFVAGLLAGLMVGVAIGVKAPFALFGLGLAIAAVRSPRTLAGLAVGAVAVVLPSYSLAGTQSVTSVIAGAGHISTPYQPMQLLGDIVPSLQHGHGLEVLALAASFIMAALLLWKMPAGPSGLPAVRPVLALTLAWLIWSPSQHAWYDVLIFPLLALMPATRVDWLVLARAAAGALGQLPANTLSPKLRPLWLDDTDQVVRHDVLPWVLVGMAAVLLWLCFNRPHRRVLGEHRRQAEPTHATSG
jgi:hypothetical protein